jgi:RNA polymerase sigma-70 factor (ECF subfamily)
MPRRRSMWRRRSMSGRHEAAGSRAHGVRADAAPTAPIAGVRRLIAQTWEARTRMMQDLSDEALMVAVSAHQQQAFRILMGRHMQRAVRVAQRVVRDSAEADDIGQDAFLRVWSHAASFDPDVARFTTWLYRIVLNLAFDRGRRRPLMPIDEAIDVRATDPEPVERLIADEERRALEQAMANLSERQRGAIALFHMEGLSGEESAKAMNLSAKAFESLLARARATLREHVRKIQNTRRCA